MAVVFDLFVHTPRLALLSPVRGCGKSNLLIVIEALCARPYRSDNVTAAAIYHELHRRPGTTLLLDEGDNLGLLNDPIMRAVFNSGHRRGGAISRVVRGSSQKFSTFAPLAVAAIGTLPLPLMHRAIVINMRRQPPGHPQPDENDPAFTAARAEIEKWAATISLKCDPETPVTNRAADNWRVLLAVADDLGHGELARSAALALTADRPDEDPAVVLLTNIRTVFLIRVVDRISSAALISALAALEDGLWNEWRGPHDDRVPRKLTQAELAGLLRPFGIRPRTIWPVPRRPGDNSSRGYLRSQFEDPWRRYCPSADTPTRASKFKYLCRA